MHEIIFEIPHWRKPHRQYFDSRCYFWLQHRTKSQVFGGTAEVRYCWPFGSVGLAHKFSGKFPLEFIFSDYVQPTIWILIFPHVYRTRSLFQHASLLSLYRLTLPVHSRVHFPTFDTFTRCTFTHLTPFSRKQHHLCRRFRLPRGGVDCIKDFLEQEHPWESAWPPQPPPEPR